MTTNDQGELSSEELSALRRIAQAQLATEAEEYELHTPFERTKAAEMERLFAEGIEVQKKRFCWLRFRFHNFKGYYFSGTPFRGYTWRLCVDCGHSKKSMLIGEAIVIIG